MATINTSAFSTNFTNGSTSFSSTQWSALLQTMEGSPTFANLISEFIEQNPGGLISIGTAGGGTGYTGLNIIIDPNMLTGVSASNTAYTATVVTEFAHELGHATQPSGDSPVFGAGSPAQAATIGDNSEGIATYQEWLVAGELGATMWDGANPSFTSNSLQQTMNNEVTTYGGINSQSQSAATIDASSYFASTLHPSSAPNFTYSQYYGDEWVAYQCGTWGHEC